MSEHPQDSHNYPFDDCLRMSMSRDDILRVLDAAPKIYKTTNMQIARISKGLIVKYGSEVYMGEANALSFVMKLPQMQVPELFDAWEAITIDSNQNQITTTYILMQFIEGDAVADVWPTLSTASRLSVCEQIKQMVLLLQETDFDQPGPLGGGISNGAYFTFYGAGPFLTRREMEEWFDERLQVSKEYGRVAPEEPGFGGTFNRLVLCHMDLHGRNMILDSAGKVWLIDWAYAGAYPPYFERAGLLRAPDPEITRKIADLIDDGRSDQELKRMKSLGFAVTTGHLLKPCGKTFEERLAYSSSL